MRAGDRSKHRLAIAAVLFGTPLMTAIHLRAQQTIFNVRSTDVLDRGKATISFFWKWATTSTELTDDVGSDLYRGNHTVFSCCGRVRARL